MALTMGDHFFIGSDAQGRQIFTGIAANTVVNDNARLNHAINRKPEVNALDIVRWRNLRSRGLLNKGAMTDDDIFSVPLAGKAVTKVVLYAGYGFGPDIPKDFRDGMFGVLLQAGRNFGANRWQMFRHVILPGALPIVFNGLRLALGTSLAATVVIANMLTFLVPEEASKPAAA